MTANIFDFYYKEVVVHRNPYSMVMAVLTMWIVFVVVRFLLLEILPGVTPRPKSADAEDYEEPV